MACQHISMHHNRPNITYSSIFSWIFCWVELVFSSLQPLDIPVTLQWLKNCLQFIKNNLCSISPQISSSLSLFSCCYTVQCCYNAVHFLQNHHKRHPIACPLGFIWQNINQDLWCHGESLGYNELINFASWYEVSLHIWSVGSNCSCLYITDLIPVVYKMGWVGNKGSCCPGRIFSLSAFINLCVTRQRQSGGTTSSNT